MADVYAPRKLDDHGRCCGRKPLFYQLNMYRKGRDPHYFCTRCNAEYTPAGEQRGNWAWQRIEGGFTPKYATSQDVIDLNRRGVVPIGKQIDG